MKLLPKNIFFNFEFEKILDLAAEKCIGIPAKLSIKNTELSTNYDYLKTELELVDELKQSLSSDSPIVINEYTDVTDYFHNIKVIGFVLPIENIVKIHQVISSAIEIQKYFNSETKDTYKNLKQLSLNILDLKFLHNEISMIIDDSGEIKSDASPRLLSLSKSIVSKQIEIDRVFNRIAIDLKTQGLLSETIESYRNGRRVLSLPVENKRKIRGIIHDESSTGKTVYIEPEVIIDLNNDLFDLEIEYKNEIYIILKELTNKIRPSSEDIVNNLFIITKFDEIAAKAKVALMMNASKPILSPEPIFDFRKAFHPLLYLKNHQKNIEVIPFDLSPDSDDRIVIISGPNAGGKSITLKAVALFQMMIQSGFLVPMNENSKIGIFHNIFADIGDQQSVEDSLSTYSSRLKNMKEFAEYGDDRTLVLIDEFGTGTDPKIGGAIAEAVLNKLNKLKVFGIITTHYTNLKLYAFKHRGVTNASMHFDKEKLTPTYKFILGKPGSSFAFEMAQTSGLDNKILNYARFKAGKNIKRIEDILVELQNSKTDYELKLIELKEKERNLDNLIKKNNDFYNELNFNKKKLKLEKKQQLNSEISKLSHELNKKIYELGKEKKLEEAKKLAIELENKKKIIAKDLNSIKSTINSPEKSDYHKLKEGDYVKFQNGNMFGQILRIRKNKALLQSDNLQFEIPLEELQYSNAPIETNKKSSIKTSVSGMQNFEAKLDIRGYTKAEAMETLHSYFDSALLSGASYLTILHGKGNGTLRNLVKQIANEYNIIEELSHPDREHGGDGITQIKTK
ncbi:MAG: Smr/MutS family protein [Saprospiraceae bacterium]